MRKGQKTMVFCPFIIDDDGFAGTPKKDFKYDDSHTIFVPKFKVGLNVELRLKTTNLINS